MNRIWACAAGVLVLSVQSYRPMAADNPPVTAPELKVGDSWVIDRATQKGPANFTRNRLDLTIDRVSSDNMVIGVKPDGAPTAPQETMVGPDWSNRLLIDGQQKTTSRNFSFPMRVGDSWTADWVDPRHRGNQVSTHMHRVYKVVGWEDVTVPAGTFHALKIEESAVAEVQVVVPSVATSTAIGQPGSGTAISHAQVGGKGTVHETIVGAIYYAPEVKYYVKEFNEHYDSSNVMVLRETDELISFKPAA